MSDKQNINLNEVLADIEEANVQLKLYSPRSFELWQIIQIPPELWCQSQYPKVGKFWVVAIMGKSCLYCNFVEGGWGWGAFHTWGSISQYHWQIDELVTPLLNRLEDD